MKLSLSESEVKRIQEHWSTIRDRKGLVLEILLETLKTNKEICQYFALDPLEFENMDKLPQNHRLHHVAWKVERFLDSVIPNLNKSSDAELRALARQCGAVHYEAGVSFTADSWLLFKRNFVSHLSSGCPDAMPSLLCVSLQKKPLTLEFEKLFRALCFEIKQGYIEEAVSTKGGRNRSNTL